MEMKCKQEETKAEDGAQPVEQSTPVSQSLPPTPPLPPSSTPTLSASGMSFPNDDHPLFASLNVSCLQCHNVCKYKFDEEFLEKMKLAFLCSKIPYSIAHFYLQNSSCSKNSGSYMYG